MAKDRQEQSLDFAAQQRTVTQRAALADVYSALEAEKLTKEFSAFTFEEALDAQIQRISGSSTKLRPNELDRINNLEAKLTKAVEELKGTDPETFREPNEETDVNTPADG